MRTIKWLTLIAPALVILGMALLGTGEVGAHEPKGVDLELSITNREQLVEQGGTFVATVQNNSETAVRDIRVQFEVEDITESRTTALREEVIPDVRNQGRVNYDTLEWTIARNLAGNPVLIRASRSAMPTSGWPRPTAGS